MESTLLRHPDVGGAAVVGVCEESNETVVAFVVRTSPSNACNEDVLNNSASTFIAPFKRPSHVFFVDELPQTARGKVRKHELVETARALLKAKGPRA